MTTAIVQSVTYSENRTRTIEVICPHCSLTHEHSWPLSDVDIGHRQGHCGKGYDVELPSWANDPRYRMGYAKHHATEPHPVVSTDDRDDNAIHVPVNNWEE